MNLLNCVRIILIILPVLMNCQEYEWQRLCANITCSSLTYQINDDRCEHIGHITDPFTNECVAKCDSPCIDGHCSFCYCNATNEDAIKAADPLQCQRVLNGTNSQDNPCMFEEISCANSHVNNYFDPYECVPRCDEDSCGKGRCTKSGYCVCDSGYRPDITNPRICVQIREINSTKTCGECKNGCCNSDGVCQCWADYELDVAGSTCVLKNDVAGNEICDDVCVNGKCSLDCVCDMVNVKGSSNWNHYLFIVLAIFLGVIGSFILLRIIAVIYNPVQFRSTDRYRRNVW